MTYLATAVAASHMELQMRTRELALKSAALNPYLHQLLDPLLYRSLQTMLARLHTVTGVRVPERVANLLLELAEQHGDIDADTIAIGPRVTREDLASMVGSTVYTTSRLLAEWEKAGILRSHRRRIRLLVIERLRGLAKP